MSQRSISILGSGWLGQPLIQAFIRQGYVVNASTRSDKRLSELMALNINLFQYDIDQKKPIQADFLNTDTLIINIPSKNIEGFSMLVKTIKQSPIRHVLFISSTSVYPMNNQTISESDLEIKTHPLVLIENQLKACSKFETTICRFAGLIGDERHPGGFFTNGKKVKNPDACVNLIHQDDCIAIIQQIIKQQVWGETFNACADTHPSKREFYTLSAKKIGYPTPEFEHMPSHQFKCISNTKLKKHLNYSFKYPDLLEIYR